MSLADQASLLLIPSGYKSQKLYSIFPTNGVGDFDFSRSGSATRIAKNGLITTVDSNVPRLEYPLIDGVQKGCPSLILEPQRTNLITYSEDFSDSSWTKSNTTLEANVITSPDGTLTATKLLETTTNSAHVLFDATTGLTPNSPYNFSIFVKKLNRRYVGIQTIAAASQSAIAFFDLDNGILVYTFAIGTGYSVSNAKIEKYSDGWYRLSATFTTPVTANYPNICLADSKWTTGSSYNNFYTGDTTKGVYVWGGQYEQASYATSYIPTNGSTVTRSAETATGSGDAATFNDSEGVLMVEGESLSELDVTARYIQMSDGTSTPNGIQLRYYTSTNLFQALYYTNSAYQAVLSYTLPNSSENNKIVFKYKENDFALWVNGIEIATDLNGITGASLSKLNFDYNNFSNFYGNTKQLQYYNSALTDSELEKISSWTSFTDMANGQLYTIE